MPSGDPITRRASGPRTPGPHAGTVPPGYNRRSLLVQFPALLALWCWLKPRRAGAVEPGRMLRLVAFGDSLVAGYLLPAQAAFPAVLEKALRAEGFSVRIVNAGVSGDTASGGLARLDWTLGEGADGVILELGANDMLRGIDPQVTKAALDQILARLQARGIKVLLVGMRASPSLGKDYKARFDAIYPALAKTYGVPLYPFFLDGIADKPDLKLADGLHPNAVGVGRIVAGILPVVRSFLRGLGGAAEAGR